MRVLQLFLLFCLSTYARGDDIRIVSSDSLNGKYYMTIEPHPNEGIANGTVAVRFSNSSRVAFKFEWEGFGEIPDENVFKVFWNQDSDAFAISYELTRGYMSYDAYAIRAGHWVKLTSPDYVSIIFKQQSIAHGGGKGYETPDGWADKDTLRLNVGGRACTDQTDAVSFYFGAQVWLHLERDNAKPRFTLGKIVSLPPSGG